MTFARALLLCLLPLCGCSRGSPESAARALATAARDGDRDQVMALLGPRTRARLGEDARVASEQAGRRRLGADDLLAIGWAPPADELDEVREVEREGDHAVVELAGRRSRSERIELVREHGAWKVELP